MLSEHNVTSNIFAYPYGQGALNQTIRNCVKQYHLAVRGVVPNASNESTTYRYNLYANEIFPTTAITLLSIRLNTTLPPIILFYHKVEDGFLKPQEFDAQMQYLKEHNFTVMTLKKSILIYWIRKEKRINVVTLWTRSG